jgi:hypothetical protein
VKVLFLVINEGAHPLAPFKDKYVLFESSEAAFAHAKTLGWESPFGLAPNLKPGTLNKYQCGDVNVGVLGMEVR